MLRELPIIAVLGSGSPIDNNRMRLARAVGSFGSVNEFGMATECSEEGNPPQTRWRALLHGHAEGFLPSYRQTYVHGDDTDTAEQHFRLVLKERLEGSP